MQSYREELKNSGTSTPYILSRLNVDLSTVLVENAIHPTRKQSAKLKKLRALQNIRILFEDILYFETVQALFHVGDMDRIA